MDLLVELYKFFQSDIFDDDYYAYVEKQIKKSQHVIDQIRQTTTLQELYEVIHKIPITSEAEENDGRIIDELSTYIFLYVHKGSHTIKKRITDVIYTTDNDGTCIATCKIPINSQMVPNLWKISSNTAVCEYKYNGVICKCNDAKSIVWHNHAMYDILDLHIDPPIHLTFKFNQSIKTPIIVYIYTEYIARCSFINIFIMLQYHTIMRQSQLSKCTSDMDVDSTDEVKTAHTINPSFSKLLNLIMSNDANHSTYNKICIEMCELISFKLHAKQIHTMANAQLQRLLEQFNAL